MQTALRAAAALIAFVALPLVASAAAKPFPALAGWDHTTPHQSTGRLTESYKKGDQLVTYLTDANLSYADQLAAVKKNIADNGIKPTMDTDLSCGGKHAHEVEMLLGITVYHQLLVDDSPGVTKVTYARAQGSSPANDALAALQGYCS